MKFIYSSFLLLLMMGYGCKKQTDGAALDVKKDIELLKEYFTAATTGVISSHDELRYVLFHPIDKKFSDSDLQKIIKLSPSVNGKVTLTEGLILTFTPDEALTPNTNYNITIDLPALDKANFDKKVTYNVRTFNQNASMEVIGLEINDDQSSTLLVGVLSADRVDKQELKKSFSSSGSVQDIIETSDRQYTVKVLFPKGIDQNSYIRYDLSPISVDDKGSIPLIKYDKNQFSPIYTRYDDLTSEYRIYMSQQLSPNQDMTGLLTTDQGSFAHKIDKNVITVFLDNSVKNKGQLNTTLSAGIASKTGQKLDRSYTFEIAVQKNVPQVKFVSDGHYFSNEGNLKIPISTKALEKLRVVVIEIKQENVKHYLAWQSLQYEDQYRLRLFGKPVYDEVISLDKGVEDATGWKTYGIDLTKQINKRPGSIYYVALDFSHEHTTLSCKNSLSKYGTISQLPIQDYYKYENSGGEDENYFQYYDWEKQSNDPCDINFYYDKPIQQRLLICSNFSTIAKKAGNTYDFSLSKLMDLSPVPSAEITLYDLQGDQIGTSTTSAQGFAEIKTMYGNAVVAAIKKGADYTYISLKEAEANSCTEFDVTGDHASNDHGIFTYTERDMWRPGDSIFLDVMLNDEKTELPTGLPLKVTFYNPDRHKIDQQTQVTNLQTSKIYSFKFHAPSSAKTGVYYCKIEAGPLSMRHSFRVETIKPNLTEIMLQLDNEKDKVISGGLLGGVLTAKYLTGVPAKGSKVTAIGRYSPIQTPFDKYKDYSFVNGFKLPVSGTLFEATTDAAGKAAFKSNENYKNWNNPFSIHIELQHTQKDGGIDREGKNYKMFNLNSYVGVKALKGSAYGGAFLPNDIVKLEVVRLDNKSNKIGTSSEISYEVFKNEKYWWLDKYALSNNGNYVEGDHWKSVEENSLSIKGKQLIKLNKKHSNGAYKMAVTDNVSGHIAVAYFNVYDGSTWLTMGSPELLTIATDKDEYNVGDNIVLDLPYIEGAKALVSLEQGNKIIEKLWYPLQKNSPLSVKVRDEYGPNVYLNVSILQPYNQSNNDLPTRMYGIKSLAIYGANKPLEIVTNLPEKIETEKPNTFTIKETTGQDIEYTISFVDEGLLGITGFDTPDPNKYFNGKNPLLVATWDIYNYLMAYFKGNYAGYISIGGDDAYKPDALNETNRFKAVVKHMGPFKLGANKSANHNLAINGYIGKLRMMVVATNGHRHGQLSKSLRVISPLMVQTRLPRVLNVSDIISLPVMVSREDKSIAAAQLTATSNTDLIGGLPKNNAVNFNGKDLVELVYDLKVKPKAGTSKIDFTVSGSNKKMTESTNINVQYPHAYTTQTQEVTIAPGKSITFDSRTQGYAETFTSKIAVSGVSMIDLEGYTKELQEYPYGCLEQITSGGFAALLLPKIIEQTPAQKRGYEIYLGSLKNKFAKLQRSDGTFQYWENGYYDGFSDTYAGHLLSTMVRSGVLSSNVDSYTSWVTAATKTANSFSINGVKDNYIVERENFLQAYRLCILSRMGKPAKSAMNRMGTEIKCNNPNTYWLLAEAYRSAGYDDKAREYVGKAEALQISDKYDFYFGSDNRSHAIATWVLAQMPDQKAKAKIYYDLMVKSLKKQRYTNTQDMAWAILATQEYLNTATTAKKEISYKIANKKGNNNHQHGSALSRSHGLLPNQVTTITNTSTSDITITNTMRFIDNNLTKPATKNRMAITTSYKGFNQSPVPLGQDILINITVTNPEAVALSDLALQYRVPSGWELINDRYYGRASNENVAYQDYRDDRVYTFFSLGPGKSATFSFKAKASYKGTFYLPAVKCEAMYQPDIYAQSASGTVKVQ